jgi:hypothetical protein
LTWKLELEVDPAMEKAIQEEVEEGTGVREVTGPDKFSRHREKPGHMKSNDPIKTLRRTYTARSMWW